jgi:tetratricopeptide (TPR) repeat protein
MGLPDITSRILVLVCLAVFSAPAAVVRAANATSAAGTETPAEGSAEVQDESSGNGYGGSSSRREDVKRVVTPRTGKLLIEATDLFSEERFDEAERVLAKLRRMNPYEKALANRMKAYIAFARDDTDAATGFLESALEDEALPLADHADVLFQLARLQATRQDWKGVASTMPRWFAIAEDPNTAAYHLLALAYFQLGKLDAALTPAQQAVEVAEKPHQAAIQLLLAIHLTRKDYAAATPVLVRLLSHYPDAGPAYWLQLASLYGVQGDLAHALAVLQLAERRNLLEQEGDHRRLAQLLLHQGVPHRAARMLETALEHEVIAVNPDSLELLSSGWILARESERAEGPLARAAELSATGELFVRLAQIHMLGESWVEGASALRRALEKGGLGDPGATELLLGVAYFNAEQFLEARSWFARAQTSVGTREQAATWLEHVQREVEQTASARAG